jgi:hypothetical protein
VTPCAGKTVPASGCGPNPPTERDRQHQARVDDNTLGTFWRSLTFGRARQLDRFLGRLLGRAWQI